VTRVARTCRAGADIGGTFTDVVLEVDDELHSTKVLTDYAAPERAMLAGLRIVVEKAGIEMSQVSMLIHGTTLATNALIERRGARTALITTEGFRHVIEMRTESRFEQYDLNMTLPQPLIERADRYTVRERLDARGDVLLALDEGDLLRVADTLAVNRYESVAVCLLHSYANDMHEHRVREVLMSRLPAVDVSISCEVSPQFRELERTNTVCANAYVRPLI
jgi:N-methylhydantoinase A